MKKLLLIASSFLVMACGSDDPGSNNGATNNGATNNGATNNGATNNGAGGFEGYSFSLEGGEDVIELPGRAGDDLGASVVGDSYQLTGVGDGGASELTAKFVVGSAIEAKDYSATTFIVSYPDQNYTCTGGTDITITVTNADPARGTFTGPVGCTTNPVSAETTFTATVTGEFGETL